MNLYVIRHAEAADPAEHATDDERPLTTAGRAQTRRLAVALAKHGIKPPVVLTSPLVRARQTAEGLLTAWKAKKAALRECAELAPGGKSKDLAKVLSNLEADAAAVGHNPDLEQHIAWLIGSKKARVAMAKAAVACLLVEPPVVKGCATLLWLVTPEWL